MTGRRLWIAIAAIAAAQTAVLGWMLADRMTLLRGGREIVLDVEPVDPRSLFQGDYVVLGYGNLNRINGIPVPAEKMPADSDMNGRPYYVTLAKSAAGTWDKVAGGFDKPASVAPDQVMLAGRISGYWSNTDGGNAIVNYGIESWFVSEGQGHGIEDSAREKKLQVLVAVDTSGHAAIKGLVLDGKTVLTEPLL